MSEETLLKEIRYNGDMRAIEGALAGRKSETAAEVTDAVAKIIADVRARGDEALFEYCEKLDGYAAAAQSLVVTNAEKAEARAKVDRDYIRILRRARDQITEFHRHQLGSSWNIVKEDGVILGQVARPLERVALYVPGGTAAYPSTVLMNAVPALLAGVKDVVIITPVKADGQVNPVIVAAAEVAGIDTIYKCGGAHGVAAAAYGTASVPRVEKIVGPGNIFVATAKKLCFGAVGIDMVAGPSEVLVLADATANPKYVAADLMAQAEHDVLASAILVTTDPSLPAKVATELDRQVGALDRADIIRRSMSDYGGAIIVETLDDAFDVANYIAPEHLEILTADPLSLLPKVHNAGSIFLGENSPEPLGDYMSGTNHVLPTSGTARFYSGLGVYDFIKFSSYSYYPRAVLETFKDDVVKFAKSEGLGAHANSIAVRFEGNES